MADKQLLPQSNDNCVVITAGTTPNHSPRNNNYLNNNNHIITSDTKLINRSNGDINGAANSINLKNGSIISPNGVNIELPATKALSSPEPPDGGARAWCVMISAFFCNSIIFGIINTYGIMYIKIFQNLEDAGHKEAASKASLVGSLTIGTTFFLSPVSGILTDKIGLRMTTFIGGIFTTGGMLLSSMVYTNINLLYITYGLMFGFGAALAYTPTIAILGHYFKRYLGVVSGFVTCGSSLFTIILPKLLTHLLEKYDLNGTCVVLGAMSSVVILCALIYKPTQLPPPPPKRKVGQSAVVCILKSFVNVDNWKKKRYVVWALSIPVALIGYFVPYVHMVKYVNETYPEEDGNWPIMCIGLTSGIGRLFFGYIADYKWVNRILLQQMSFVIMGLFIMAIPMVDSYPLLLAISLGMGVVDGCFISLLGPVAYDLCGAQGASQAIGFMLGLCAFPLTAGAPIAGFLYDETKSYRLSFILAGIPALVGAVLMTFTHYLRDDRVDISDKQTEEQAHKLLNKPAWTEEFQIDDNTESKL